MPTEKVILAQAGDLIFSCDFESLDEVAGTGRMVDRSTLPEGLVAGHPASKWVSSRSRWFPVRDILPEARLHRSTDQVLVVRTRGSSAALRVSHVLGFEILPRLFPAPLPVLRATGFPLAGFRLRGDRVVLELDLSRLIE